MPRPSVEAERREQILSSACRVIADKGFRALRIADVAERTRVSPGIIHYYFANKRELVKAAFEHNFADSLRRRAAILDSDQDALTKLRALVEDYLPDGAETVRAWHVWATLWVEGLHDPELQELNERAYGEWRRLVTSIVRAGQADGQIADTDPVEVANVLVGLLDGLAMQVLLGSRNMALDQMRDTCHAFLDRIVPFTDRVP
ncbi:TetR family transcriptional regulator [Tamaricihabitans halophyticus]|uniref:TetR family transcriptional regulator n=1 Tax=Tamaricihabitans halophyticus TaxID=1262583 RepID=A0A4R2QIY3_9PSEU|nr:TetR/AcrR family transcriptional regulator [Tamaricihabitans halophyticus]TCP49333.1 TetR family transcriptional regulator [Tamaricihabitans halophyticus]